MTRTAPGTPGVTSARLLRRAALLGGPLRVRIDAQGTGGTWAGRTALTRWRPDLLAGRDAWGFQVEDTDSGRCWPLRGDVPGCAAEWAPGCFTIARTEDGIEARLDVSVSATRAVELRRVTLHNRSGRVRRLALASVLEVNLNDPAADAAHPAFSKLFVQTEYVAGRRTLLARRRPRAAGETHPVMALAAPGTEPIEWETDRARLYGRGDAAHDRALRLAPLELHATTGNVLDPAFAFRRSVELAAGEAAVLEFVLAAAADRDAVLALIDEAAAERVETLIEAAARDEQARLERLQIPPERAARLQALGAAALAGDPGLRARAGALGRAGGPLARLAAFGLDPAAPLVTVRLPAPRGTLEDAMQAVRYWRELGFPFELLVVADVLGAPDVPPAEPDRGVHVVAFDALGAGGVDLALAAACWAPDAPIDGTIAVEGNVARAAAAAEAPPAAQPAPAPVARNEGESERLLFDNGIGGFSADGRTYVIRVDAARARPPAPWVNVIANERIGCLVSESGAASTWGVNSREYRLTPWSNDPVLDPHTEALYVRDEDTGAFWSPLPGPAGHGGTYEVRHGLGVSTFLHERDGLEHETQFFVARESPVRFCRVRLVNRAVRARRLSVFAFQQLVLGSLPEVSARFVSTSRDRESGALFAVNAVGDAFAGRVAFADVIGPDPAVPFEATTSRTAFLGPQGDIRRPAAVVSGGMAFEAGPGLDPCFALRGGAVLGPGEEMVITFLLGDAAGMREARTLLARFDSPGSVDSAFARATGRWSDLADGLQIETPHREIDLMVNGWLPYQALGCRMLGRTAFYQSGGAYGFRDQLQDAGAFAMTEPALLRRQILLHAAHQFVEGDVLHWWHPPADRGMRTRFADDLLWLPYLTATYVQVTGDDTVLDEHCPFLTARALEPGEAEAYLQPRDAGRTADVFTHACLAIDRSLATGAHGLPLFGCGDWNDGMNRVGHAGRGESVWMAFFLIAVIDSFAPIAERRGDAERAGRWRAHARGLREAVERHAWDGEWYLRAYDDDGRPLGTRTDDECRIDGLVQAWSVISGAAPAERARQAIDAMERHLVSEREGIIRLLTPPFENTQRDPGYIKGYVKGVRENGGQYTHAALWMVRALAELGRSDRAGALLAMLSPVRRAQSAADVERYRVEPYVVAADVYGAAPHVGRGGWTWYTGSASWMFRVALGSVLGVELLGGRTLRIRSRMPDGWPQCRIEWRVPGTSTRYVIDMQRSAPGGIRSAVIDGQPLEVTDGEIRVPVLRDGGVHRVAVEFGAAARGAPRHAARGAGADPIRARGGPGAGA